MTADAATGGAVGHLQDRHLGIRARLSPVHPEPVRELVEMPVGADQQIARRYGGRRRGRGTAPARQPPVGPGQPTCSKHASSVRNGWRVAVVELAQRTEQVAAGAAQPLREHPGRHAEVVALPGPRVGLRLPGEGPELAPPGGRA